MNLAIHKLNPIKNKRFCNFKAISVNNLIGLVFNLLFEMAIDRYAHNLTQIPTIIYIYIKLKLSVPLPWLSNHR